MNRSMNRSILTGLALVSLVAVGHAGDEKEPAEVTAIRKRLPQIKKDLERIRGLKFKQDVKVEYQSSKAFKEYMGKQMESMTEEEGQKGVRLYASLGLLPKTFNMKTGMVDLMESQALAHYSPVADTFYVLKTKMPADQVDPSVLHELQHAIQDQYFELDKLMNDATATGKDDRQTAVRFLFEGEATYVMILYALEKQEAMLKAQGMTKEQALDLQLNMIADKDRDGFIQIQKMGINMSPMDPEAKKAQMASLDKLAKTPRYLFRTLVDPYNKGARMVAAVIKEGGWKAIKELYANPPLSTEQVLHPEKLLGDRDDPTNISLADVSSSFGEGWSQGVENTLGEIGLRTVFKVGVGDDNLKACAGWDGDRIQTYEADGGKTVALVWHTVWDSDKDAIEFAIAYKALLAKKYKLKKQKAKDGVLIFKKGSKEHVMILKDSSVLIIEGAPKGKGQAIADAVVAGATVGGDERPTTGGGKSEEKKDDEKKDDKPEKRKRPI